MSDTESTQPQPLQVTPALVEPPPAHPNRTWLIVLSVVVAIQMLLTITLGLAMAFAFLGPLGMYGMMPNEELYMQADALAYDVAYYIQEGDTEGYMRLYEADDPHVDRESARAEFEAVVAASQEASGTHIEYMADTIIAYDDEDSGERLVKITLSGMDYESGAPRGKRLTVWAVLTDGPEVQLTGPKGRDLSAGESVW